MDAQAPSVRFQSNYFANKLSSRWYWLTQMQTAEDIRSICFSFFFYTMQPFQTWRTGGMANCGIEVSIGSREGNASFPRKTLTTSQQTVIEDWSLVRATVTAGLPFQGKAQYARSLRGFMDSFWALHKLMIPSHQNGNSKSLDWISEEHRHQGGGDIVDSWIA